MDMCFKCRKSIKNDPWWSGFEEPKTPEDVMQILKDKSQEIILCNNCADELKNNVKINLQKVLDINKLI